jgi:glycosyltransferase involved in cell wall biosynthesis
VGAERTVNDIRSLASREKFDLIWFVLNSPSVIHLVQPLAKALDLPYIVTIWDPPEYFLRNMHIDPCTVQVLLSRFRAALLGARRVSVIGAGMRAEYRRSIGIEGVPLNHGISPDLWRRQRTTLTEPGKLTLGFAGSLYAKREWNALIKALSANQGMIAGRRVVIRFVGRKPRLGVADADFVEHLGILSFERTNEVLAGVDLCYLPYWFSTSHRVEARLSFPSKLSSYVASGGAVFIHAPSYASPALFHDKYPVGILCNSSDVRDIVAILERFVEDESLRQRAAAARVAAMEQEFSLQVMLERFLEFSGVDLCGRKGLAC